jgi:hypothetical protein
MNEEDCILKAQEIGLYVESYKDGKLSVWVTDMSMMNQVNKLVDMVRKDERERCAQICEDHFMSDGEFCARQIRRMR